MMDMPMSTGSGVVPTYSLNNDGNNGCCNNNGFNNGWEWIWIILIFAIFGWGNNGFGGFGGGSRGGFDGINCGRGVASPEDINSAFSFNQLDNGIRGLERGMCDGFYAMNTSLLNGFSGVGNAISNLGYETQSCCCATQKEILENRYTNQLAVQGLQSELASCCCDIEKSISDQNFLNAQNTNAIIQASNDNTRAILDKMCQNEIQSLRTELQSAQLALQNNAQTQTLINAINPTPVPAYSYCQSMMGRYGGFGYGYNNCGCGCGCNNI